MKLSKSEFYDKVLGCWMGKNIGGTLGTPDEWKRQINNYTFYTHDINGDPLPNDDLDLQIIFLYCVERKGLNITARDLAEYWLMYQIANYGEYGMAKANIKSGILPPCSGTLNNRKKDSCGAFIRSELWACMCPARPDLAVKYAYEDAIVDHGDGEGTYAEFFTAAMESAAFVENDIRKLIEIGLSYIPKDCGVAKAIETVFECYEKGMSPNDCRDMILEKHRGCVPDHIMALCSKRDVEKGFHLGKLGYDVPSNIAIIVAGLLYGEGDFEKSILVAANMGEDTDCTAGTVGALFGILLGNKNLPAKWTEPIGHNIKTICCNQAHGADYIPKTVEELTDRVIKQARAVCSQKDGFNNEKCLDIFGDATDLSDYDLNNLLFPNTALYKSKDVSLNLTGPKFESEWYSVALDYEDLVLEPDGEVRIGLKFDNFSWPLPLNINVKWISDDLEIKPGNSAQINAWIGSGIKQINFQVSPIVPKAEYKALIECTITGTASHLYIPVYLTAFRRKTDI